MSCAPYVPSGPNGQKIRVAHELRHVELLPHDARFILVFGAQPGSVAARELARPPLRRIAQSQRAVDQQRGRSAEALREEQQPGLFPERYAAAAEEGRKI